MDQAARALSSATQIDSPAVRLITSLSGVREAAASRTLHPTRAVRMQRLRPPHLIRSRCRSSIGVRSPTSREFATFAAARPDVRSLAFDP